ncbi:hypothetical protein CHS0354_002052 [Potamilus streckersoni]|uniref:Uncharacterized protein n=1 Tax=Potamilus streckersoni TaxID=2493646 RepID=A0AAE0W7S0_9BIVA|nr:hypothetical protein CHS0354_002052 [Potamilus streckersoni]
MEKALAIIQFKLEEKTIREFPEFEMSGRLWLEKFAQMLKSGNTEGITDTHLPTLDLDNPLELTAEEERVMDELHRQFIRNSKLKYYIGFFFRKGKMYHVSNNILNIHALIPSTPDGGFETVFGKKGVELFNWLDSHIRKTGHKYLADESVPEADLAIFFYLWCGPKSPLFGKNAMKTFERYFFSDKTTHKETTLYWEKNLLNPDFRKLIQHEFRTGRQGDKQWRLQTVLPLMWMAASLKHTLTADMRWCIPLSSYMVLSFPLRKNWRTALTNKASAPLKIEIIHDYSRSQKIKDTMFGLTLKERRENLYKQLRGMTEQPE